MHLIGLPAHGWACPSVDSIDPAIGEAIGQFADGGVPEADAAIAAARHVFDRTTWAQDARLRQDVLLAWATALDAQREPLATLLTRENGKAIAQIARRDRGAISEVRYYAGLARHIAGHALEPEPGTFSTMLREAAASPGSSCRGMRPAVLLVRSLAPALARAAPRSSSRPRRPRCSRRPCCAASRRPHCRRAR